MEELLKEITLKLATNQSLTESVLKAARQGFSIELIPVNRGTQIRVLLIDTNENRPTWPAGYAQNRIDASIMEEHMA